MQITLRPVVSSSLLFLVLGLAGCASPPSATSTPASSDADIALYKGVMDRIRSSYVEPVTQDQLVSSSLKGMLTGLDPHSDYMTESEYQDMLDDSQGEFAGIGAELTREDGHPKVISPIDDTPAAHAGIRAGDVILKIDGKLTDGQNLKDVVDELRGPAGKPVLLTIGRRDTKPFDVTLVRAIIHVASVKFQLEPQRIGYARITSFAEHTQRELVNAIATMSKQAGGSLDGFVLDLRNDPGGLLEEAVRVSGDFLDGGVVVSTKGRDADDDRVYHARPDGDRVKGVPVVVLINGASASASEIVAGALQDRHRATLLGTKSFGKGSVQTIIPLDGRGALRLTTARYYTPSGRSIQAQGIVPDEVVALPKSEAIADGESVHEADLRGALDVAAANAKNHGVARSDDDTSIDPAIIGTAKDYQLAQALAAVHLANQRPAVSPQASGKR